MSAVTLLENKGDGVVRLVLQLGLRQLALWQLRMEDGEAGAGLQSVQIAIGKLMLSLLLASP